MPLLSRFLFQSLFPSPNRIIVYLTQSQLTVVLSNFVVASSFPLFSDCLFSRSVLFFCLDSSSLRLRSPFLADSHHLRRRLATARGGPPLSFLCSSQLGIASSSWALFFLLNLAISQLLLSLD